MWRKFWIRGENRMTNSGLDRGGNLWRFTEPLRFLLLLVVMLSVTSSEAAGVVLKLGDILAIEPGNTRVVVIDPATGAKTTISQGGLLSPPFKVIGVTLATDGNVIV